MSSKKSTTPALYGGRPLVTDLPKWPIVGHQAKDALNAVLESRNWGLESSAEQSFTKSFIEFIGAKYGLALANGTVTLEVAMRACGIQEGDEVIVPSLTWVATASSVITVGAKPIFVDVEKDTLCIDPTAIKKAITEKTRAIIPVHLYGNMADMDAISQIAREKNLIVIEDCAHAHGSEWKGQNAGSIGDFGSFSFQMSKLLTAGEGGFITAKNKSLADLCYSYKNVGRKRNENTPSVLGFNYRITEFQCALLLTQLENLEYQLEQRHKNARLLDSLLADFPGIEPLPHKSNVTRNSHYRYVMRYDKKEFSNLPHETLNKALEKEGILIHSVFTPVYREELFPVKTNILSKEDYLPVTESAIKNLTLLNHQMLLDEKIVRKIPKALKRIQEYAKKLY